MDMPEQKLPDMLSQMLQMFPNVPQDIISLYVQRYSTDIEMCVQMLHLQSGKYTGMKSFLTDSNNVNELKDCFQSPHFLLHPETLSVNNNDLMPSNQSTGICTESESIVKMNENVNKPNNAVASNSWDSYLTSQISSNAVQGTNLLESLKKKGPPSSNFYEPLKLDIAPDEEGILHSWRPNMTDDGDLSDLFYVNAGPPKQSKHFKNIQLNSDAVPSTYLSSDMEAEVRKNLYSDGRKLSSSNKNEVDQNRHFTVGPIINFKHSTDVPGYIRTQRCCLNHMWFDYTETKNEFQNLKECVGKLTAELKEKMELVNLEVIEELNKEIVELRLECQCLCSEVDNLYQGLLGEVDEKHYEESKTSSSQNAGSQSVKTDQKICTNSHDKNITESQVVESSSWQCSACTYDNYPAVDVCEICCTPKPPLMPPFVNAAPNTCYCHPKEKSLSVQS